MTEKIRERIIVVSASFIGSFIIMVTGFSLNATRSDGIELKKEISSKVPIVRYEEDCKRTENRLEVLEKDRFQYTQSISTIETHILWIRQELEMQRKERRGK